ncbi:MAG: Maf family protein [Pseudomonadota bacterium]
MSGSRLQQPLPPIVLASASPARARLLAQAGIEVGVQVAPVDEALVREGLRVDGVGGAEAAVALASLKGERVALGVPPETLVLAGDQLLETDDGAWLEKAESADALVEQLSSLQGRTHRLHTAAVLFRDGARIWHHVTSPRVTLRPFDRDFARRYVEAAGDALLGCVGGYQLEGLGPHVVAAVAGDAFAVQGLPLLAVVDALRTQGALAR